MTTLSQQIQASLAAAAPAGGVWQQVNTAQNRVLPYVVWTNVVSVTNNSLDGASDLQNTRVQVDVYSLLQSERDSLALAVIAAIEAGPFNAVVQISGRDLYDVDLRAFRRTFDFSIWSRAT